MENARVPIGKKIAKRLGEHFDIGHAIF